MTDQSDEPEASAPVAAKSSSGLSGPELWEEVRIEPVEIALPGGVALTLRAFRKNSELTPTEIEAEEEDPFDARKRRAAADDDDEQEVIVDEEFQALLAKDDEPDAADDNADDEPDPAEFEDEKDEAEDKVADEDVPMFLSHKGRLLAFKSAESLVSFIRSGAPQRSRTTRLLGHPDRAGTVDRRRPAAGRPLRA